MYKINLESQRPISWEVSSSVDKEKISIEKLVQFADDKSEQSNFSEVLQKRSLSEEEMDPKDPVSKENISQDKTIKNNDFKNIPESLEGSPFQKNKELKKELILGNQKELSLLDIAQTSNSTKKIFSSDLKKSQKEVSKKQFLENSTWMPYLGGPFSEISPQKANFEYKLQNGGNSISLEKGILKIKKETKSDVEETSLEKNFLLKAKKYSLDSTENAEKSSKQIGTIDYLVSKSLNKEASDSISNSNLFSSLETHLIKQAPTDQSKISQMGKNISPNVGKSTQNLDKQEISSLIQGIYVDSTFSQTEGIFEMNPVIDTESVVLNQVLFQMSKVSIPTELFDSTDFIVRLYPRELGDMIAELKKTEDGIALRLFVESSAVKEILESNMQSFEEQLSQSEVPFTQIDVELRDFNQNSSENKHDFSQIDILDAFTLEKNSQDNSSLRNKRFDRTVWENRFFSSWQYGDTLLELFA